MRPSDLQRQIRSGPLILHIESIEIQEVVAPVPLMTDFLQPCVITHYKRTCQAFEYHVLNMEVKVLAETKVMVVPKVFVQ